MIKAAIFDMDGVIINSEPIHDKVWKQFYEQNSILVTREELDSMRGIPPAATIRKFMPQISNEAELNRLNDERAELLTQAFTEEKIPLVDGISDFMQELQKQNIHIAVATSTKKDIAVQVLQKVRVYNFVDVLVGGDEITKGKPDPDIFLTAAKKLGVTPQECVVFEDSQAGVEAGLRAKMYVVAILTTHEKEDFPKVDSYLHDFTGVNIQDLLKKK